MWETQSNSVVERWIHLSYWPLDSISRHWPSQTAARLASFSVMSTFGDAAIQTGKTWLTNTLLPRSHINRYTAIPHFLLQLFLLPPTLLVYASSSLSSTIPSPLLSLPLSSTTPLSVITLGLRSWTFLENLSGFFCGASAGCEQTLQ